MNRVTLFGASYSVYVRIVRLVLEEIGVPYELVEIDIFAKETRAGRLCRPPSVRAHSRVRA